MAAVIVKEVTLLLKMACTSQISPVSFKTKSGER